MRAYQYRRPKRAEFIVSLLVAVLAIFNLYAFLHEMGQTLVGMINWGKVGRLVFDLNGGLSLPGTAFNHHAVALFYVAGLVFPVMVLSSVLWFYQSGHRSNFYTNFHIVTVFSIVGNLVQWIVIPIVALFSVPPACDATRFLQVIDFNPLLVSLGNTLLGLLVIQLTIRKGVLHDFLQLLKNLE